MSILPPNLENRNHDDWPPGFRWVPRRWTAWNWGAPVKLVGNQSAVQWEGWWAPKPIGERGSWQVSYFPGAPWWAKLFLLNVYFAFTTKGGVHFRIGARWDDVDFYTEMPEMAIKWRVG